MPFDNTQIGYEDFAVPNDSIGKKMLDYLKKLSSVLSSTAEILLFAGIRLRSTTATSLENVSDLLREDGSDMYSERVQSESERNE